MNRIDFESLGDIQKRYESVYTDRKLIPNLPVMIRLDGRAFHTFTNGLARPFDEQFSDCMIRTMKHLVEEFNPAVAYTQSDEITLGFLPTQDLLFGGKVSKIETITAASCSVKFNSLLLSRLPNKVHLLPVFDSRVWNVPTIDAMIDNFIWRQTDASRNSITMAAHTYFSNSELHGVGTNKKLDMLCSKGINWNDYPVHFKRGIFARKNMIVVELDELTLSRIPEHKRPTGPILRRRVDTFDPDVLTRIEPEKRFTALFGKI